MTKLYLLFAIAVLANAPALLTNDNINEKPIANKAIGFKSSMACPAVSTYAEDFTSVTAPNLPTCWEQIGTGGTVSTQSVDANSSPNTLYLYSPNTNSIGIVAMPDISNIDDGTHQLRFSMRATITPGGVVEVGYMNNRNNTATFRVIQTVVASTLTYQTYIVIPGNLGGSGDFLAFRHTGSPSNSVLIDDVFWEPIPACQPPTGVSISSITTSGASINWTSPSVAPANYQLYINTSNTAPTDLTTPSFSNITAPYALTNLTANTTYYVWVRSNCGAGGVSAWSLLQSFTTACAASGLPYSLNFDGVVAPAIPACVTMQNVNSDASFWRTIAAPAGYSGNVLVYRFDQSNAANDWFFTNGLSLTAGRSYIIKYKFSNGLAYSEKLKVSIGTTPTAAAMTTSIADYPAITDNVVRTHAMRFTVPTTGIYYVGFQAYSSANQFELYLDEISVTQANVAPTPLNSCITVFTPLIDALSNNKWMALIDASGNIIGEINGNGNNLGNVVSRVYRHSGNVRSDFSGRYYMDRNIEITPSIQPTTPVSVRIYFTAAELAALQSQPGAGVSSFTNISVFKNNDPCGSTVIGGAVKLNSLIAPYETDFVATFDIPRFSSFYFASSAYAVLPAQLLTFSGTRQAGANHLKWSVAQEQDVSLYHVERSNDGTSWIEAGTVASMGNTSTQRSYSFVDPQASGAKQLYRLRVMDRSGRERLSKTITVFAGKPMVLTINGVFPNPASEKIQASILAPQKEVITLLLIDATGRVMRSQRNTVDVGSNTVDINITGLAKGTYLLKVLDERNGVTVTERFVKE